MPSCYQLLILAAAAIGQSEAGVLRAAYARWKFSSTPPYTDVPGPQHPGGVDFLLKEDQSTNDAVLPPLEVADDLERLVTSRDLSNGPPDHLDMVKYVPQPVYEDPWRVVYHSSRHKHGSSNDPLKGGGGVAKFFASAVFFEWCIFLLALPMFVMLHYHLIDWPSTKWFHSVALFVWLGVAQAYLVVIWSRLGANAGMQWLTGYVLEFIFSIENVFVFHIVVKAFKTPRRYTQKLLFIVICCQIAFEAVFYMGLADMLRRMLILPYILGVWLLYVGVEAGRDDHHGDLAVKETSVYKSFERILGNRLRSHYDDKGNIFSIDHARGGRITVTLLGPVLACLLVVDFLLEVDVTLTKIEELQNEYIAFTSSVVAAFAVPELFFVARDLFQRYYLLKYGISFVLIFFGMQMLFHSVFNIPDLVGCAIMVAVMCLCMALSSCLGCGPGEQDAGAGAEEIPLKGAAPAEDDSDLAEGSDSRLPAPAPIGGARC